MDFQDLRVSVVFTLAVALYHQSVSDICLHRGASSSFLDLSHNGHWYALATRVEGPYSYSEATGTVAAPHDLGSVGAYKIA